MGRPSPSRATRACARVYQWGLCRPAGIAALLAVSSLVLGGSTSEVDSVRGTIIRGIKHRETAITTVECFFTLREFLSDSFREDVIAAGNERLLPREGPGVTKYFWATDGVRWRCEEAVLRPEPSVWSEQYRLASFDGQWFYWLDLYNLMGSRGMEKHELGLGFTDDLLYFMTHHNGQRLSEWLSGEKVRLVGQEPVRGAICYKFVYGEQTAESAREYACWVDPELGFATRQFTYRLTYTPPRGRLGGVYNVLVALEFVEPTEGIWLPSKVKHEKYYLDPGEGYTWRKTVMFSLDGASVNQQLPQEAFQLRFPIGTWIARDDGTVEVVGGRLEDEGTLTRESPPPREIGPETLRQGAGGEGL